MINRGLFTIVILLIVANILQPVILLNYSNRLEEKYKILEEKELQEDLEYKQTFFSKSPKEGLKEALYYYSIEHPDIVYKQAILETGNFKSDLCVNNNNLFGLYDSKNKKYYSFNHWSESVIAYKKYIQYRYKGNEDYYKFLQRIGYAKDKQYISKLKSI